MDTASSYSFAYTAASAATYVIFELPAPPTSYINSLPRSSINCGTGSDVCLSYDLNTQWVLFIPSAATTSISITLPSGTLKNGVWVDSPTAPTPTTFYLRALDASGNVISKVQNTLTLTKATISVITFDKDSSETALYKNSEHLFEIAWTSIKDIPAGGSIGLVFAGLSQQTSADFYCRTNGLTVLSTNTVEGITCTQSSSTTIKITNLDAMASGSSLSAYVRLVTGTTNVGATVTVSTYRDSSQSQLVEVGVASVGTAYDSASGLQDFWVDSPVSLPSKKAQVVPIVLAVEATSASIYRVVVTFPSGFSSPSSTTDDYPYCTIDNARIPCSYTLSPLVYTVTLYSALSGTQSLALSTIYTNPLNGVLLPSTAGYYNIQIELKSSSNSLIEKNSKYIFIAPDTLDYFDIRMAHRTINAENLFIVTMKTSVALNAYNDATDPGKIHILFPKYAADGTTVAFASDLGTGLSASAIIPCSFDGLTALASTRLQCRLIPGFVSTSTDMVKIEVINFDTVAIGTTIIVRIAKVKNPAIVVQDVYFKVDLFQITLSTGVKTYIHQDSFNLFMNLQNNAFDSTDYPVDYSGGDLQFAGTPSVYDTAQTLNLKIWVPSNGLNPGDFFITQLPSTLSGLPDNVLSACIASLEYCYSFPDANLVIYEVKTAIAASTATLAAVTTINMFESVSQTDLTFYSNVIQSELYVYQVKHVFKATVLAGYIGSLSSGAIATLHASTLQMGRTSTEILVSFTTAHEIPSTGSIFIKFPADFTKIYGGCRSYVTSSGAPSVLTSKLGTLIGDISCYIISTNTWYIKGFSTVAASSSITIYGLVDLPTSNTGNSIEIDTFSDQDETGSGLFIDKVDSGITLTVGTTGILLNIKNIYKY